MREIDWDSTPGCCCLKNLGSTNRQIFRFDGVSCDPDRVTFVRAAVRCRFNQLMEGQLIADNINLFVKREPASFKKESLGRYRLISGVSLIDCFVDRILFGWLLRILVLRATETPSMVGWSPLRGGWRHIWRVFRGRPVVCLDKSSWDWTVVEWMVKSFREFVLELPVNPPDWWVRMVKLRFRLLYRDAVYEFQDGTIVRQNEWGVQKSGSLLTIIFNCVCQSLCHYHVMEALGHPMDYREPLTLGDDTVQETPPDLVEYVNLLTGLGPKLKGVKVQHWVEFAGFAFLPGACVAAYWKKHLYKLRYAENPVEMMQAYQVLYAHDPEMFEYLVRELLQFGPEFVLPRRWCLQVFDDPQ